MKFSGKHPQAFQKLVSVLGLEGTLALIRHYGGTHIYVPKISTFLKERRNEKIFRDAEYNGLSTKEIAKKWDMKRATVLTIIHRYRKKLAELAEADEDTSNS